MRASVCVYVCVCVCVCVCNRKLNKFVHYRRAIALVW